MAALTNGPETDVKVMATALRAGILLDATVVRALLVPALVVLFGKWDWWLPQRARQILRVPAPPPLAAPVRIASHVPRGHGWDCHLRSTD